ncbi:13135_t:CDS:2 [Entrophospora sp. SA101]|nr:13135_t:CDS:2 [Entrophospora sp. SA101]
MEEENIAMITPTKLTSMKRTDLQRMCKKFGLKASGKNTDLQKKLATYALEKLGGTFEDEDYDVETVDVDVISNRGGTDRTSKSNMTNELIMPTTPQTPTIIPKEQINDLGRSLLEITQNDNEIKESDDETMNIVQNIKLENPFQVSIDENIQKSTDELIDQPIDESIRKLIDEPIPELIDEPIPEPILESMPSNITTSEQVILGEKSLANMEKIISSTPIENKLKIENLTNKVTNDNTDFSFDVENQQFTPKKNPPAQEIDLNVLGKEPKTPVKHVREIQQRRVSNFMELLKSTPMSESPKFIDNENGSNNSSKLMKKLFTDDSPVKGPQLDQDSPFVTMETKIHAVEETTGRTSMINNDLLGSNTDSIEIELQPTPMELSDDVNDVHNQDTVSKIGNLPVPDNHQPQQISFDLISDSYQSPIVQPNQIKSSLSSATEVGIMAVKVEEDILMTIEDSNINHHDDANKPKEIRKSENSIGSKRKDIETVNESLIKKQKLSSSPDKIFNGTDNDNNKQKGKSPKKVDKKVQNEVINVRNPTVKNTYQKKQLFLPNPEEQRKKEFLKRKQAAKNG